MSALSDAHITAEARLRTAVVAGITSAWQALPAYDEENVPAFLRTVLPLVAGAQRASASLTNAYLARQLGRGPLPLDPATVTGAAARAGTPPADVYRRPFVGIWTALAAGTPYTAAVSAGLARATATGAMDVQLAMRATAAAVSDADPRILGYKRVPDPGACDLCRAAADNFYRAGDLMPIHNHCGCGIEAVTSQFDAPELDPAAAAVHEHGELGPVLGKPGDDFTQL